MADTYLYQTIHITKNIYLVLDMLTGVLFLAAVSVFGTPGCIYAQLVNPTSPCIPKHIGADRDMMLHSFAPCNRINQYSNGHEGCNFLKYISHVCHHVLIL